MPNRSELVEELAYIFSQVDTRQPMVWARLVNADGEEWFIYEFDGENLIYGLDAQTGEELVFTLAEVYYLSNGNLEIDRDWVPIRRDELL